MQILKFQLHGFKAPFKVGWLDIESEKVPVLDPPEGWPEWTPGKPCPFRSRAFMVGIGYMLPDAGGSLWIDIAFGSEMMLTRWVENMSTMFDEFHYSSTNKYDEDVLKGKFANARRSRFGGVPPWSHVDHNLPIKWVGEYHPHILPRVHPDDVSSKDCPALWNSDNTESRDSVILHNFLDVLGMPIDEGYDYPEETVSDLIQGDIDFRSFLRP